MVDMRSGESVWHKQVHKGGVVDCVNTFDNQLVTGGSDGSVYVLDMRGGVDSRSVAHYIPTTSPVHCLANYLHYLLVGQADGNIIVYDLLTNSLLYAFGAMSQGVVRKITINHTQDTLIAIGDDFSPLILYYY